MNTKEPEFIEILSTFDPALVVIVKSILDAEKVDYYLKGEHLRFIEPIEPVRLMVKRRDATRVKELLSDLI